VPPATRKRPGGVVTEERHSPNDERKDTHVRGELRLSAGGSGGARSRSSRAQVGSGSKSRKPLLARVCFAAPDSPNGKAGAFVSVDGPEDVELQRGLQAVRILEMLNSARMPFEAVPRGRGWEVFVFGSPLPVVAGEDLTDALAQLAQVVTL
jgi:hypothetical protein